MAENGKVYKVTAGVPQGSIVGATLWNLLYNGVLQLKVPKGITLIAYADDLAVVGIAKKENELIEKVNITLGKISEWMKKKSSKLP